MSEITDIAGLLLLIRSTPATHTTSKSTTLALSTPQTTTIAAAGTQCVVSEYQKDNELLTDLFAAYYKARSNKRNKSTQVRFERSFICDCYSCREGKGTLYGVQRLELLDIVYSKINAALSNPKSAEWLSPVFIKYSLLFLCILKTVIFSDPTKGCYRKGAGWNELPKNKSMFYCKPSIL